METVWNAHQQEQDFIRALIPHLKNGIEDFKTLTTILLNYDESKNHAIQQYALKGKQEMELASSAASAQLSKVDEFTEKLTARKGQLDQQQTDEKKERENLETERHSIAVLGEKYRRSLDDAQKSLDSARGTLEGLQKKKNDYEIVRGVGIGLFFLPFIGTIAGAVMIGVSQTELNNAESQMHTAEEEVKKSETAVKNYSDKLEEKKKQCTQKNDEIAECSRTIEQIKQSLEQVSTQRNTIIQIQEKVRSAVNMLDTLAGRAKVAKTLTEHVICLPPIFNVLGNIIKLMLHIQGNRKYEILKDPQVKAAILSLQEIYKNVSAIDNQQTLNEIHFY